MVGLHVIIPILQVGKWILECEPNCPPESFAGGSYSGSIYWKISGAMQCRGEFASPFCLGWKEQDSTLQSKQCIQQWDLKQDILNKISLWLNFLLVYKMEIIPKIILRNTGVNKCLSKSLIPTNLNVLRSVTILLLKKILEKVAIQWVKDSFSNKWYWESWKATCKRIKVEPYFKPNTKVNFK